MDFFAMAFYGVICGVLGFAAPMVPNRMTRFAMSAVVGVFSATIGPGLRGLIGM